MPNLYMPRHDVHARSEAIGEEALGSQAALQRLLKDQKRLIKFLQENQASMDPTTAGVSLYLTGVIIRLFDTAGGRLRSATWAQVREAAARVQGAIPEIAPLDDGWKDRFRALAWRAQPHVLDEALMALFERDEKRDEEEDLPVEESFKVFCLLWVATEVLDGNWRPTSDFAGETDYTYVHIVPEPLDLGEEAAAE